MEMAGVYRDWSPRVTRSNEFTEFTCRPDIRGTRTASQFLRAITPVYYNYTALHRRYKVFVRR